MNRFHRRFPSNTPAPELTSDTPGSIYERAVQHAQRILGRHRRHDCEDVAADVLMAYVVPANTDRPPVRLSRRLLHARVARRASSRTTQALQHETVDDLATLSCPYAIDPSRRAEIIDDIEFLRRPLRPLQRTWALLMLMGWGLGELVQEGIASRYQLESLRAQLRDRVMVHGLFDVEVYRPGNERPYQRMATDRDCPPVLSLEMQDLLERLFGTN